MKENNILKILESLGLSRGDVELFFFLSKKGPAMEDELTTKLQMSKKEVSKHLKTLCDKGLIKTSVKQPILFFAIPFETALDLLLSINLEQTNNLRKNMKDLLKDWDLF